MTAALATGPIFTDNQNGTADISYTTTEACYSGIDAGAVSLTYTESAFSYNTLGDNTSGLYFGTSHTVRYPEISTVADGTTIYYRVWMQTPDVAAQQIIGGGYIKHHPDYFRKSRKQIRKEREALGISTEVLDLIDGVAKRQAKALESDTHKQFEELERVLELSNVEWQARYLEVLNDLRERYISEEISRLLAKQLRDKEDVMILMALAALI